MLEPNSAITQMNQHADNAATHAMNNLANHKHCPACVSNAAFPFPTEGLVAPLGLRFSITIGGIMCDSRASKSINDAVVKEYHHTASFPVKQGAGLRHILQCKQSVALIPRTGLQRKPTFGAGSSMSRLVKKDTTARIQTECLRNCRDAFPTDTATKAAIRPKEMPSA
jgi:hypothetical protein